MARLLVTPRFIQIMCYLNAILDLTSMDHQRGCARQMELGVAWWLYVLVCCRQKTTGLAELCNTFLVRLNCLRSTFHRIYYLPRKQHVFCRPIFTIWQTCCRPIFTIWQDTMSFLTHIVLISLQRKIVVH